MAQKYIGITIGPIFDTINLTSSPAALWAASYMFSSLTKYICEVLTEEYGVKEEQIVSPYYNKNDELLNKNNGVGLFHDRIIFRADGLDYSKMNEVRNKAIVKLCELYGIKEVEYMKKYLAVYSVEFTADNPIKDSAKALDCIELAKPFVFEEKENPIFALFVNAAERNEQEGMVGKNDAVKALTRGFKDFQLEKKKYSDGSVLKSLSDIAKTGTDFKKFKYYAIVRSDGDNMSQIISSLNNDKEINDFSKVCLEYCSDIAELVGKYGGATIYSGGDDLLAILPCEKDGASVFDFVNEANGVFKKHFRKYNKPTSLSFGITIAYYKFPLYEALEDSANLLFGVAKKIKNCSAVRLQKHSGQSASMLISNDSMDKMCYFLKSVESKNSETLLSAMHKLSLFEDSFSAAEDVEPIKNLFVNTFDADAHKNNTFVHKTLPEMLHSLKNDTKIFAINEEGVQTANAVLAMCYMLRVMKFFVEKDGGKE